MWEPMPKPRLKAEVVHIAEDRFHVRIPVKIESLNYFLPNVRARMQWKRWQEYLKTWALLLNVLPIRRPGTDPYYSNTIVISHRKRLLDSENVYGGSKPIRDTLERRGWIHNDSPKWSYYDIRQATGPDMTEIYHVTSPDNYPEMPYFDNIQKNVYPPFDRYKYGSVQ